MKIVILEDERHAASRLKELVAETAPDATICAVLESVSEARDWFADNTADLILADIHLSDTLSLELFADTSITTPVIFTTAYDAYVLRAFKFNSIDYLLKPISKEELDAALRKFRTQFGSAGIDTKIAIALQQMVLGKTTGRSRFLVRRGERLIPVSVTDTVFIRADDKLTYLYTRNDQQYLLDENLDTLETQLDPDSFFRINRSYIASIDSIEKVVTHLNGRLKVSIRNANDEDIFVSKARANIFKKWLGK
ncbi:MAG: response regulator transcription factor [Flavipsychrobacter sp.]|nr:response regulator transcription factor [Flavipsychrobacter sp.]